MDEEMFDEEMSEKGMSSEEITSEKTIQKNAPSISLKTKPQKTVVSKNKEMWFAS
jgi:hypothetical protein